MNDTSVVASVQKKRVSVTVSDLLGISRKDGPALTGTTEIDITSKNNPEALQHVTTIALAIAAQRTGVDTQGIIDHEKRKLAELGTQLRSVSEQAYKTARYSSEAPHTGSPEFHANTIEKWIRDNAEQLLPDASRAR